MLFRFLGNAYEHPDDAGIEVAKCEARLDTDELVSGPGTDDDSVMKPQLLPSPKAQCAEEIDLHNTTPATSKLVSLVRRRASQQQNSSRTR